MNRKIAIIGLGYVGLPLALAFSEHYSVIGFDINESRISVLKSKYLRQSTIKWTHEAFDLKEANFYIIAVPTPVDDRQEPDLSCLRSASKTVGLYLKAGDIVVYESTVYPGATQEECVPWLEYYSKLVCGEDFSVGYSPERINAGDEAHQVCNVVKVISGWDKATTDAISEVYGRIVKAGLYIAPSIQVAEAAKVVENIQRDLNIALMNELAIIFAKMNVDTQEVLRAASTKWNFQVYQPGLVGGHCISVDPYYMSYKAQKLGCHPELILTSRKVNNGMGKYIAHQLIKQIIDRGAVIKGAKVLILGLTFKENCPDLRNAKVKDLMEELQSFGVNLYIHDPIAVKEEVEVMYKYELSTWDSVQNMEAIVLCLAHRQYCEMPFANYTQKLSAQGARVIFDIKGILNPQSPQDKGTLKTICLSRL